MQVRDALARLHRQSGLSAGAFAQRVGFTNPSILSQFNTAIDLIGEKAMETALAYIKKHEYVGVVTDNYAKVFRAMEAAYRLKNVQVIIGEGGYGKSFAIERYRDEKEREGVKVYVVNLEGVRTKKGFVRTVAEAVGVKLPYQRTVIKDLIGAVREALLRLCDVHNIPVATNVATAEVLIQGLARGDLAWRDIVNPKNHK